jgi:hypothetical protein
MFLPIGVFLLVYLFVWRALPVWFRVLSTITWLVLCLGGILFFFRVGFIGVLGYAFLEIGINLWSLGGILIELLIYAFTGHCIEPSGCFPK